MLFQEEGTPHMRIETDLGRLIKRSMKEEYQDARLTIMNKDDEEIIALPSRIRARGNMRKKVCRYPPIKIDFKKKDLELLGVNRSIDKLKH